MYIHVYQIIKNRGPGPYNSLCHTDNIKYFSGLSLMRNRGKAHMLFLAREVEKLWRCSYWEKGNFIMINEFKYVQVWTIWPSPLSLSLYSTFKSSNFWVKIHSSYCQVLGHKRIFCGGFLVTFRANCSKRMITHFWMRLFFSYFLLCVSQFRWAK